MKTVSALIAAESRATRRPREESNLNRWELNLPNCFPQLIRTITSEQAPGLWLVHFSVE